MPHKDPEEKRVYMRQYHRDHREARKANKKASAQRVYARDPEAVKAKWRKEKKIARSRAALHAMNAIRAAKAAKKQAEEIGYSGNLKPKGF